jgi:hypothetical protein
MANAMEKKMSLSERLIETGLVASSFVLDLNKCLRVNPRFNLDGMWSSKSRAFQFPIRYREDSLAVPHALLKEHPFVTHVEQVLGVEVEVDEASNPYVGYHHAVDLISTGAVEAFEATRALCCDDDICSAVQWSLRASEKDGGQYLPLKDAKKILRSLGSPEPSHCALLRKFSTPVELVDSDQTSSWPINTGRGQCLYEIAWTFVHAIEAGYFKGYGKGSLEWSPAGVDYYHGRSFGLLI